MLGPHFWWSGGGPGPPGPPLDPPLNTYLYIRSYYRVSVLQVVPRTPPPSSWYSSFALSVTLHHRKKNTLTTCSMASNLLFKNEMCYFFLKINSETIGHIYLLYTCLANYGPSKFLYGSLLSKLATGFTLFRSITRSLLHYKILK